MNEANTALTAPIEKGTLSLVEVLRHVELVERVLKEVMKEGTHYGESFPGDKKKNLLKPGADKLCLAFGLSPSFVLHERELPGGHREYRFTCVLTTATGRIMGEGVGSCSTMEGKYRWRNVARKCPECGKEAIIKGKEEYGGGWVCFRKKDGCGAKWPDGAAIIENQEGGKVENADIADVYNTCLKIGKKRAYVDATITATAASDLFTQDIEDLQNTALAEERKEAARDEQRQEERREAPKANAAPAKGTATGTATQTGTKTTTVAPADNNTLMHAAYKRVQVLLGAPAAVCVWKAHSKDTAESRAERLRVLTAIVESCESIVRVKGEEGHQLIQDEVDAAGNDQMTKEQVSTLVDRLVAHGHGEVLAPAGTDAAPA